MIISAFLTKELTHLFPTYCSFWCLCLHFGHKNFTNSKCCRSEKRGWGEHPLPAWFAQKPGGNSLLLESTLVADLPTLRPLLLSPSAKVSYRSFLGSSMMFASTRVSATCTPTSRNTWRPPSSTDIIKSNKRLIAGPKVPAKARILRQKCHLRQISVNCDKCDNLHQNSTICIKTALFA